MRKVVVALALILGACSSPHKIQQRVSLERRDSLRAIFGEELTVCLDDFRIIPPDTCRVRIEATRVRVERRREATLATAVEETGKSEQQEVEAPARAAGQSLWLYGVVGALCFLLGLKFRIDR